MAPYPPPLAAAGVWISPFISHVKSFPPCSLFAGAHRFSPPPKQEVGRSNYIKYTNILCSLSAPPRAGVGIGGPSVAKSEQRLPKGLGEG